MKNLILKTFLFLCIYIVSVHGADASDESKPELNPITQLEFLVGNWEGPGITYNENGDKQEYFDREYARFDLNRKLLLINATGIKDGEPYYQLHTIIYYDKEAEHFVYTPYSGSKPRSFKCELIKQEFKCLNQQGDYRLTFRRLKDGRWNEFGERKTKNSWMKRFETILSDAERKDK